MRLALQSVVSDVSEAERLAREKAEKLAQENRKLRLELALAKAAMFEDALTGVNNRRRFDQVLALEVERSQRTLQPLSLLLLDLDNFKRWNDEHGHEAGDDALRATGRAILSAVRVTDACHRYGGEEFAILLPLLPRGERGGCGRAR
jgi:PleD family two-component response regulator